jgi:hypothetical protein
MSLQLHRPDGRGGLEADGTPAPDYRDQLRNPRWGAALKRDRLPSLANPEMRPTGVLRSVLFWLGLAVLTFVILVVGYGIGLWQLTPA